MKAISIRQPWAWLIVNGYKDIENRTWYTRYRGPVLVHAAKGMTRSEYQMACDLAFSINPDIFMPAFEEFERGGIVGYVTITGCTNAETSPWFFGPIGFELTAARPLPFHRMTGRLNFFETGLTLTPNANGSFSIAPEEKL